MEKLFTLKGLKLDNKNISFFCPDMFESPKHKVDNKFIAKDEETLLHFLCDSVEMQTDTKGLGIVFMNDNSTYIAMQDVEEIIRIKTTSAIRELNNLIKDFDIKYMTIMQQSKSNNEEFYFISLCSSALLN